MRLFSYCVRLDDGAAPNPYWGICTLTICKPVIRRNAKVGDWVVGIGSSNVGGENYSGKLVYAMLVTEVLTLKEYDSFCRANLPGKIPKIYSRDYRKKVGDCIYDYSNGRRPLQRRGVHEAENQAKDLRGENALLSDHFFYFGKKAIEIPDKFSVLIRNGQGHQSDKNKFIKEDFVNWITSNYKPNKLYGPPQVEVRFSKGLGNCAEIRCEIADEDEKDRDC